jgi:hypothetical protein
MAFIVEQFVGDKGIQIGYEDIIRPFSFGTNWQKLRVGILCAMNGNSNMPDVTFPSIGICTGYNARLSNSCTDALFMRFSYGFATMQIAGVAPNRYYALGGGTSTNTPIQRVGSADANCGAGLGSMYAQLSANPGNARNGFMFTVTKGTVGAAAISCDLIYHSSGGTAGATDVSRGTFLAQMESETTGISPMSLGSFATTLPTRFVKDWDSMFVNWLRVTPTMVIDCMTVVRFQ